MYSEADWRIWLTRCRDARRLAQTDRWKSTTLIRELLIDAELMLASTAATSEARDLTEIRTELQSISQLLEDWRDECRAQLGHLSTTSLWAQAQGHWAEP